MADETSAPQDAPAADEAQQDAEGLDWMVAGMEAALVKARASVHKNVKLQQAELDFLSKAAAVSSFMEAITKKKRDREKLKSVFGIDMERLGRVRAALEAAELTGTRANDTRLEKALQACEATEGVLKDVGVCGEKLQETKKDEKQKFLKRQSTLVEEVKEAGTEMKQVASQRSVKVEASERSTGETVATTGSEPPTDAMGGMPSMAMTKTLSAWYDERPTQVESVRSQVGASTTCRGSVYETKIRQLLVIEDDSDGEE
eukprot:TRINITY_DN34403_c0_g1_i1.p1 TRINITY_DN34403_c0_g1~~TRINITY_DN34403_c0_g1_i1.p1  ORF type:complete len:259 (-),score=65.12 TRINITY_DN34403_c0_g1_i1:146-922(-)